MKSFKVLGASVNPATGFIEVVKELTADDNTVSLNLHTFHPECLEWKAAELGLTDPDEIIDGILHEPFFEDVQPLQLSEEDARTLFRTRLSDAKTRLTNSTPRNVVAIKAALRNAGVDQRHIDAIDNEPFQVIRNACLFDAEVIVVKQEHIHSVRSAYAIARAKPQEAPLSPSERVARIRQQHAVPPDGSRRQPEVPVDETPLPPIILEGKRGKAR